MYIYCLKKCHVFSHISHFDNNIFSYHITLHYENIKIIYNFHFQDKIDIKNILIIYFNHAAFGNLPFKIYSVICQLCFTAFLEIHITYLYKLKNKLKTKSDFLTQSMFDLAD